MISASRVPGSLTARCLVDGDSGDDLSGSDLSGVKWSGCLEGARKTQKLCGRGQD